MSAAIDQWWLSRETCAERFQAQREEVGACASGMYGQNSLWSHINLGCWLSGSLPSWKLNLGEVLEWNLKQRKWSRSDNYCDVIGIAVLMYQSIGLKWYLSIIACSNEGMWICYLPESFRAVSQALPLPYCTEDVGKAREITDLSKMVQPELRLDSVWLWKECCFCTSGSWDLPYTDWEDGQEFSNRTIC